MKHIRRQSHFGVHGQRALSSTSSRDAIFYDILDGWSDCRNNCDFLQMKGKIRRVVAINFGWYENLPVEAGS